MAVFDINDYVEEQAPPDFSKPPTKKDKWISSVLARSLFILLLIADLAWGSLSITKYAIGSAIRLITLGRRGRTFCERQKLAIKRASICALSLFTAIFSPAIGILFGCTYFMVYDPTGIDEVVPASLRSQFDEFMQ